jgi:GT2 family glycosyltransferase
MSGLGNVTACVKTFLRDSYLFDCVHSLRRAYPEMLIAVADDGHHSVEKDGRLSGIGVTRYIHMPYGVGLSAGRNALVDSVTTDYALIGDDDFVYAGDTGIEALLSMMDVADIACGSAVCDGIVHRYEYTIQRRTGNQIRFIKLKDRYENHAGINYAEIGIGLNFFLAKTAVLRSVRWDNAITVRWEHEDFFLRASEAGVRVVFCPEAKVIHRRGNKQDTPEYTRRRHDDTTSRLAFMARWGSFFRSPWESNFK